MVREKDVSTRLIRPTVPHIDFDQLLLFVERWNPQWELDGSIKIFDEGIAQYMLSDLESHYKYFAGVILNKASLRCQLIDEEPEDVLDEHDNTFQTALRNAHSIEDEKRIDYLKAVLSKRGYRFE